MISHVDRDHGVARHVSLERLDNEPGIDGSGPVLSCRSYSFDEGGPVRFNLPPPLRVLGGPGRYTRDEAGQCGPGVAVDPRIDVKCPAYPGRVPIHLNDLGAGRDEAGVPEARAYHEHEIRPLERAPRTLSPDGAKHADAPPLRLPNHSLCPGCRGDRGFQLLGQLGQKSAVMAGPPSGEDRHPIARVHELDGSRDLVVGWLRSTSVKSPARIERVGRRRLHQYVGRRAQD